MSQNNDPFREEDVKKPEKEKDLSESFDADLSSDEDDDVIDLLSSSEEPDDEEIFELKETVDEMSVPDEEDDIIELTPEAGSDDEDEDVIELADETTEPAAMEVDEDKQILELIDDIQSTLDDTKETKAVDSPDESDQTLLTEDNGETIDPEEPLEESILLGDDEILETDDLSDDESEFADHLGLDLTAEFSKEMFSENSKMSVLLTERIEEAVDRVVQNMLSDENSSLVQAIKKVAKREIE